MTNIGDVVVDIINTVILYSLIIGGMIVLILDKIRKELEESKNEIEKEEAVE